MDHLLDIYRTMFTIRKFEEVASNQMVDEGIRGLLHSSAGQEAVAAGVCLNLKKDDYLTSTHRGHGHAIGKGVNIDLMMAEIFGRLGGANKGKGGSMHIADASVGMLGANGIVGSSIPLACGAALKAKIMETSQVAVSFFGDGATSQGVLHESMNLAAIWKLPVIFVCENNMYAQSTPSEYAVSVENIADRSRGYGIPGEIVDGMDPIAVFECAKKAIERAREGEGPTFIEAKTYRYGGHFVGDNPLRYRPGSEELEWKKIDPIPRFRVFLLEESGLTKEQLDEVELEIGTDVLEAVKFANQSPLPSEEELVKDVYADYPLDQLNRTTDNLE
ncbi:MAG: thiamine pyrophosphate-dependent dehydrogenase E1 component subunit alpha [Dehalococcoidia bacterium]